MRTPPPRRLLISRVRLLLIVTPTPRRRRCSHSSRPGSAGSAAKWPTSTACMSSRAERARPGPLSRSSLRPLLCLSFSPGPTWPSPFFGGTDILPTRPSPSDSARVPRASSVPCVALEASRFQPRSGPRASSDRPLGARVSCADSRRAGICKAVPGSRSLRPGGPASSSPAGRPSALRDTRLSFSFSGWGAPSLAHAWARSPRRGDKKVLSEGPPMPSS